jgi:RNA-directed DNA polymerase
MEKAVKQIENPSSGETSYTQGRAALVASRCEALSWTPSMLKALEQGVQGRKWYALMDKIYHANNLEVAFESVRENKGAPGVDRVTIGRFQSNLAEELSQLGKHLKENSYKPSLIKRVYIPKPGSKEKRPLGIPAVRDRVVQAAVKQVIEPIFEYEFLECSYGFRPQRGCKDALREVTKLLKAGYCHVVDADIRNFFGALDHTLLMGLVKRRISDGRVLTLLEAFLTQGVMEDGVMQETRQGTPQGGVISPLLANVYLHELDVQLSGKYQLIRYADDLVLLCKSAEEAQEAMAALEAVVADLKLELHPEKTKLVDMTQPKSTFTFLGYQFVRTSQGHLRKYPGQKSAKKFRQRIKQLTKRSRSGKIEDIISSINPIIKGWFAYFKHSSRLEQFDGWIRRRLRSLLDRRIKKRYSRGAGESHYRWSNAFFNEHNLFNMEDVRVAMLNPGR